jgi:hypothetical protein
MSCGCNILHGAASWDAWRWHSHAHSPRLIHVLYIKTNLPQRPTPTNLADIDVCVKVRRVHTT